MKIQKSSLFFSFFLEEAYVVGIFFVRRYTVAGARLSRRSGRQNAGAGGKGMEFRMVFVEKSATAAANPYSYPEKRCRLASRCCPEMTVDGLSVRCGGFRLAISFSRNAGSPSGFSSGRPR